MKVTGFLQERRAAWSGLGGMRRVLPATPHALRECERYLPLCLLLFSVLILLTVTACASNAKADPSPPLIHYGEDMCDLCGMIINDERFAAGYVTRDGEDYLFDDIGNMFRHHLQKQGEVVAFFVHTYNDPAWIRAETAHYVHSARLMTPMLSGLVAFDSPDQAQTLAAEMQGQVMTFDEVLAYYKTNPMPQGEHSMEHDH